MHIPKGHIFVKLANPAHRLPILDKPMLFPIDGLVIDPNEPYWRLALADGSLREAMPPSEAAAPAEASVGDGVIEVVSHFESSADEAAESDAAPDALRTE